MPELKPQVYVDERPGERLRPLHAWARTHDPGWVYLLARAVLTPLCVLLFRARASGLDNVPPSGPVLLAPNHFSIWDHFFCGLYLRRRVRFMAKSQLYVNTVVDQFLTRAGAFPVRRGRRDEEAIATALAILTRGGAVVVYPEGGRSRDGRLGEAHPGIGRLALESGAPVVPVAIHGSLGIRRWDRFRLPRVTIQYGKAITLARAQRTDRHQQRAAAERIFGEVRRMYDALESEAGRDRRAELEGMLLILAAGLRRRKARSVLGPPPRCRSRGLVARYVLAEGFVLGLTGVAAGLGLGAVAGGLVADVLGASTIVSPATGPGVLATGAAVGLALGALGAVYPAWRVTRLPPAQALG